MNFIDGVFFVYIFLSLYMLSLFVLLYIQHRKDLYYYPVSRPEPVTIVMPCYNESEHIGEAIESLLSMDYPKDMIEIIVVDDKSTDNSAEVIRRYTKKYPNVRLIVNKRNSGGAAEPTNIGIRAAKYDYIAVADADSTPDRDALKKMIGFLQEDEKVGGVTCSIMGRHRNKFIEKLQAMEYAIIAFTRKVLDFVDGVYIMPGPFALYRKRVLMEVNGFDTTNMTQDIEMTWRIMDHGYKVRMCLPASVYSITPNKFKAFWKQRVRWNIGGLQTILKYKHLFFRKGMLGYFVVPMFTIGYLTGVLGLGIFVYLFINRLWSSYLATQFSLAAGTDVIRLSELSFDPTILNYFAVVLIFLGIAFTLLGLSVTKEKDLRNKSPFVLLFYLLIYLTIFPILLVYSAYRFMRGNYSW